MISSTFSCDGFQPCINIYEHVALPGFLSIGNEVEIPLSKVFPDTALSADDSDRGIYFTITAVFYNLKEDHVRYVLWPSKHDIHELHKLIAEYGL